MRRMFSWVLAGVLSLGMAGASRADLFGLDLTGVLPEEQRTGSWAGVTGALELHLDDAAAWLGDQYSALLRRLRKAMVFRLVVQGQFHEISYDAAGTMEAARLLGQVHPGVDASGVPNYQASPTWQLFQALLDEGFRAQYERIANLTRGDGNHFFVTIFLDEPSYPVFPGTVLNLPVGGTDTLGASEAFWQFLQRHGTTLDAMVAANPDTLRVSAAAWRVEGRRDVRLAEPRLAWRGGVQEFLATLLHEAGHVGDASTCSLGLGYGPDHLHYMYEVISPQGAFKEGWANYMAAVLPGKEQRGLQNPQLLEIEPASGGIPYTPITDPTLADYLAAEGHVGRMLQALEAEVGFAFMAAAFMGTNSTSCRDMGHYLAFLARLLPDRREDLKALVDRETGGVATPAELEDLLTRGFPYPADLPPGQSPRVRPAELGGASPAETVAADGAVLVEDYEPAGY